jgi:site-specific DNA-methyltransferase (adenine-specific)
MEEINLIHGDSLQALKGYAENHFDLAIVDPPYRDENQPTKDMRKNGSMETLIGRPTIEYWNELKRVSKNQIIWGANNFELPQWKGFVVWKKQTISEDFTMSMCEVAALSEGLSTTSKFIEIAPQGKRDDPRVHPTQKPRKLYEFLLKHYTSEGDLILDTHLGSGSIAIACHYMKRNLIGYEIDKEYYDAACKRFKEQTSQQALW